MNNVVSKWLVALAAILLLAVFLLRPQPQQDSAAASLLMPELAEQLEAVTKVELLSADNQLDISLSNTGGRWGLEQRDGYPIEFERLRSILRALAQLKTDEAMTSNPEFYERLGLQDVEHANSSAKAIRIYAGENKLAGLLVGNSFYRGGNEYTYLRLEGQTQSWMVHGSLALELSPPLWLDKELLNNVATDIEEVDITHADGERLTAKRGQDDAGLANKNLSLLDAPQGKELLYASVANSLAEGLQNLRLEDVQSENDFAWNPKQTVTTRFLRTDGITIKTQSERRETKYYLALQALYNGDDAALKAEAEKLNKQFEGWVYNIQPYKYQALAKRMTDMLKAED